MCMCSKKTDLLQVAVFAADVAGSLLP